MEEAPLIVKHSLNNDKCASCNQPLNLKGSAASNGNVNATSCGNTHNRSLSNVPCEEEMQVKYNLKNLHDHCVKYGTGSYSRILANTDHIKDEFIEMNKSLNRENNNRSFKRAINLPEIRINQTKEKENNQKIKIKFLNDDLDNERRLNTLIDNELNQKSVKGETLLKATNQFFEIEKKIKDNSFRK